MILISVEVTLATGSYVSYAGVTQILYYEKSSNSVYSINGGWNTPLHGDPSQIPKVHTTGYNGASVLIPGFIAGVVDASEKFSKFPLKTLFEPALYFAENGFKMPNGLATAIKLYYNEITLLRTTQGIEVFLYPRQTTSRKKMHVNEFSTCLRIYLWGGGGG